MKYPKKYPKYLSHRNYRDLFSTDDMFNFNSSLYIKEALKWLSND